LYEIDGDLVEMMETIENIAGFKSKNYDQREEEQKILTKMQENFDVKCNDDDEDDDNDDNNDNTSSFQGIVHIGYKKSLVGKKKKT